MRIIKRILPFLIAPTVVNAPVLAADFTTRPPVITADAVLPDDSSSGWYLRGDIGAARTIPPSINWNSINETSRKAAGAAVGDVGFGYRFNENFRSDLTFDFMSSRKISGYYNAVTQDKMNQSAVAIMANGYYDIMKYAGFTPYIGAGIGVAQINTDSATRDINGLATYTFGKSVRYGLAAAAMTGIAIDIGHGLQADIGYRFAWIDRSRTGAETTSTLAGPINIGDFTSHQIRVGLRYTIN
jgi:opacity protein-like surface antigen